MQRQLLNKLAEWKKKQNRKPLVIWGARQVGKTWLMQEFGRLYFENTLYISFYNNKKDASFFEEDYDVKRILSVLEIEHHTKIEPEEICFSSDSICAVSS
ncbi:MAG: AAA family ATPase [Treponemataceae bacterium]|nr:AAA family ATPase [Treponemataceae bacterium]